MNGNDIVANITLQGLDHRDAAFTRAALIDEIDKAIAAAVAAEREACAKIAGDHESTCGMDAHDWHECGENIAAAIRARNGAQEEKK